jgi:pyrimidine dimer DNA glycosylase
VRLWTLHPRYLDAQGLTALWREALLARAVLRGRTRGYRHHPQLERFRAHPAPRAAINAYLASVAAEADLRGYSFDRRKIGPRRRGVHLKVSAGQIAYEWQHLLGKLARRSPQLHGRWRGERRPQTHPLFRAVPGDIESWERRRTPPRIEIAAQRCGRVATGGSGRACAPPRPPRCG